MFDSAGERDIEETAGSLVGTLEEKALEVRDIGGLHAALRARKWALATVR